MSALSRAFRALPWRRRRLVPTFGSSGVLEIAAAVLLASAETWLEAMSDDDGQRWLVLLPPAVALIFLLRRRAPAVALIAAAALCSGLGVGSVLLFVVSWSAGQRIRSAARAAAAFLGAFVVYAALNLWLWWPQPVAEYLIFVCLAFSVIAVLPGIGNHYWTRRFAVYRAVEDHRARLLKEAQTLSDQVRMRERQRIARDMHDSLGHQLALVALHTGALEVDQQLTESQREAVMVLRQASTAAMQELRAVVAILNDGASDRDRPEIKGVAGIESLVLAAAANGGQVRLSRSGPCRPLAPAADHAAYRVAQEGLTNAYKHAPGAPITVSLRYEPDSLVVEVANEARARRTGGRRAVVSGGQGLSRLRERALLVGGMLYAGPTGSGGFRIAGMFPYAPGRSPKPLAVGREAERPAPPGAADSQENR
ncbi:sensor histidine kinase [Streptomyces humidus]|uniref:sensor histidine kinase n=1 Tax=Streptomyces humidus TaxID=52259 RepID=UPI00167C758E|nr:histidine kinase [Streptomyces humidus]